MAHPPEKRDEARKLYVEQCLDLQAIEQVACVPWNTLRKWRSDAKGTADDWDAERDRNLRAGGSFDEIVARTLKKAVIQAQVTLQRIEDAQGLSLPESAELQKGMNDALSKAVSAATRIRKNPDPKLVRAETLRQLGAFVRAKAPDQWNALAPLLAAFTLAGMDEMADAEKAAAQAEEEAKAQGMTEEQAKFWREKVLGAF